MGRHRISSIRLYIKNDNWRRIYNVLEVFLGIAFLSVVAAFIVPNHPKYKVQYKIQKTNTAILVLGFFIGGLVIVSHFLFGVPFLTIVFSYAIALSINSVVLHHSQLVEHGNLIVNGNFPQRNAWTHNLSDKGLLEKLFLFFTHGDSREHVLHHILTSVYSRPFAHKVPMPSNAVYITIKDYLDIIKRMLQGKVDIIDP